MEETKPVKAGEALSPEQITSIAGGDGSASATATVGTNTGVSVSTGPVSDPGTALVAIYEGFVDVTSHVIERVVNAVKN
jgi:hypothetical protein